MVCFTGLDFRTESMRIPEVGIFSDVSQMELPSLGKSRPWLDFGCWNIGIGTASL